MVHVSQPVGGLGLKAHNVSRKYMCAQHISLEVAGEEKINNSSLQGGRREKEITDSKT